MAARARSGIDGSAFLNRVRKFDSCRGHRAGRLTPGAHRRTEAGRPPQAVTRSQAMGEWPLIVQMLCGARERSVREP